MTKNKRPTAFYLFEGYSGVAEVHLDRWAAGDRSPATKQAARQACGAAHLRARIFPIGKPRDQLVHGLILHLSAGPRRARVAWLASLSTAQRLGMPLDAALAHTQRSCPQPEHHRGNGTWSKRARSSTSWASPRRHTRRADSLPVTLRGSRRCQ